MEKQTAKPEEREDGLPRPTPSGSESPLAGKTAHAILWFALFAGAAYLIPMALFGVETHGHDGHDQSLSELAQSLFAAPSQGGSVPLPAVLAAGPRRPAGPDLARPPAETSKARPVRSRGSPERVEVSHPIEDPTSEAMRAFYAALVATEGGAPDSITRILHYGDSMLTADTITGATRRLLQERFGDAGHGFVLPGKPWPWYGHDGVELWASKGWHISPITSSMLRTGCYGLGAVVFRSVQPGARMYAQPGEGHRVGRFEVQYLGHPRGGNLQVSIDGQVEQVIETKAPAPESGFETFRVPDGTHRIDVKNVGRGEVRLFGVTLERERAGVVYDAVGVNGLHASNFRRFDQDHLTEQVRHRDPHLLVVMLGTNESQNSRLNLETHGLDLAHMLERLRAGNETVSCLVMAPPDRAMRARGGIVVTRPIIPQIVARQREVALANGCAFWNTFEAMGGDGAVQRWRLTNPPLVGGDLTHPTGAGAARIGTLLYEALMDGFERNRSAAASTD